MGAYCPPLTREQFEKLRSAAVIDEYDCPGDTPERVGTSCVLCHNVGQKVDDIDHDPSCPLAVVSAWLSSPDIEPRQFERLLDSEHGASWATRRLPTSAFAQMLSIGIKAVRRACFMTALFSRRPLAPPMTGRGSC